MEPGLRIKVLLAVFYRSPRRRGVDPCLETVHLFARPGAPERDPELEEWGPPSPEYVNGAGPVPLWWALARFPSQDAVLHLHTNGHSWKGPAIVLCAALRVPETTSQKFRNPQASWLKLRAGSGVVIVQGLVHLSNGDRVTSGRGTGMSAWTRVSRLVVALLAVVGGLSLLLHPALERTATAVRLDLLLLSSAAERISPLQDAAHGHRRLRVCRLRGWT